MSYRQGLKNQFTLPSKNWSCSNKRRSHLWPRSTIQIQIAEAGG